MRDLITKQEAYEHLRIDHDSDGSSDDAWLDTWIPAVSEAVAGWVKVEARLYVPETDSTGAVVVDSDGEPVPLLDSDGEPTPRAMVKAAALIELSSLYRYREGEGKDNVVTPDAGYGYVLNKASTALLAPLRRGTVR